MVKYECELCSYGTKNKYDYYKHCKTDKHIKIHMLSNNDDKLASSVSDINVAKIATKYTCHDTAKHCDSTENRIFCEYCDTNFTRLSSLTRHKNICQMKKIKEKNMENEMKILNLKLAHSEKETGHYKKMLEEAGGLVKKSVSALAYTVSNYSDAPAIKAIEVKDIEELNSDHKKIVENVISAYRHKTVNEYFGKIILRLYKKNDPLLQSIWNTDVNRLTYLIKEFMEEDSTDSTWVVDKKGIKTSEYLIEPILVHIRTLLVNYQMKYGIPKPNMKNAELELLVDSSQKIQKLVNDIDDGITKQAVLKYISGYLVLIETKLIK